MRCAPDQEATSTWHCGIPQSTSTAGPTVDVLVVHEDHHSIRGVTHPALRWVGKNPANPGGRRGGMTSLYANSDMLDKVPGLNVSGAGEAPSAQRTEQLSRIETGPSLLPDALSGGIPARREDESPRLPIPRRRRPPGRIAAVRGGSPTDGCSAPRNRTPQVTSHSNSRSPPTPKAGSLPPQKQVPSHSKKQVTSHSK